MGVASILSHPGKGVFNSHQCIYWCLFTKGKKIERGRPRPVTYFCSAFSGIPILPFCQNN